MLDDFAYKQILFEIPLVMWLNYLEGLGVFGKAMIVLQLTELSSNFIKSIIILYS